MKRSVYRGCKCRVCSYSSAARNRLWRRTAHRALRRIGRLLLRDDETASDVPLVPGMYRA